MNNFNAIGRLAIETKVGNGVATNLLAVKRIYKSSDSVDSDFIPISAFSRNADVMSKYCKKGDKIGISGRVKTSTYDKNGVTQHAFEVVIEHIYLLNNSQSHSKSHEDSQSHSANSALTSDDVNELAQRLSQASKAAEGVTISDDDLPF